MPSTINAASAGLGGAASANTLDALQHGSTWASCGWSALAATTPCREIDDDICDGCGGGEAVRTEPQLPRIAIGATTAATTILNRNGDDTDGSLRRRPDPKRMGLIPTQGTSWWAAAQRTFAWITCRTFDDATPALGHQSGSAQRVIRSVPVLSAGRDRCRRRGRLLRTHLSAGSHYPARCHHSVGSHHWASAVTAARTQVPADVAVRGPAQDQPRKEDHRRDQHDTSNNAGPRQGLS